MEKINLILMLSLVFFIQTFRNLFFAENRRIDKKIIEKRNRFFDFVKGVAIFAVLVIHVSWFFVLYDELGIQEKMFAFFLNNISRFAICLFFISTGVLLKSVKNKKDYFLFLKKKFLRILLPYLLVSIFLGFVYENEAKEIAYKIFIGKASLPFYFIIILFQFYIIYPVVEKLASRKFLLFTFFVSFLSFLLPFTWSVFGFPLFFKYLFFFVYGVYSREKFLQNKIKIGEQKIWFLLMFAYLLLTFFLPAYYFNIRLVYGVVIFNLLFIYKDYLLKQRISNFFCFLGRNSLWIFLLHYPVFQFIFPYINDLTSNFYFNYVIFFIIGFSVSILFSSVCIYTYKKIIKEKV